MNVKRTFVLPLVVLTSICLIVSAALAYMNMITSPVISTAAAERAQVTMSEKMPDATGFQTIELSELSGHADIPASIREAYKTSNDIGYILIAAVNGFSGDITIICAIDNGGKIISTATLSHTETKGIGTILEEDSFLDTFTGIDDKLEGVDTVTGATISTRAFIHGI